MVALLKQQAAKMPGRRARSRHPCAHGTHPLGDPPWPPVVPPAEDGSGTEQALAAEVICTAGWQNHPEGLACTVQLAGTPNLRRCCPSCWEPWAALAAWEKDLELPPPPIPPPKNPIAEMGLKNGFSRLPPCLRHGQAAMLWVPRAGKFVPRKRRMLGPAGLFLAPSWCLAKAGSCFRPGCNF